MTTLAGEPLPVEFRHGGSWHPGVLVGWRHEPDGGCLARVQFLIGGLRRGGWLPLTELRLPEPEPVCPLPPVPPLPRPRRADGHLSRA